MRVLDRFLNYLRNKVRFGQCSKDCIEKEKQFFSKKQNEEKGPIQVEGKLSRPMELSLFCILTLGTY